MKERQTKLVQLKQIYLLTQVVLIFVLLANGLKDLVFGGIYFISFRNSCFLFQVNGHF